MRRLSLTRRAFLGGSGAMIGLPFLEAMLPRRAEAADAAPIRRLLVYYVPNGINMAKWTPAASGAGYALTPILAPLAPIQDDVLVISGLSNKAAEDAVPGDHARGTGAFLTATRIAKAESEGVKNGISVDQLAAQTLPLSTPFRSLQLGSEGGLSVGACDSGYGCAYTRNISWAGPTSPLQKMVEPRVVFDQLFQGSDPGESAAERARRRRRKSSVLDYVAREAERLRAELGGSDRAKLDEYLTGVREVELRIEEAAKHGSCAGAERPGAELDVEGRVAVMTDLMVLAFQCDLTRIITFMLANSLSNRSHDFLGAPGGHHELSHHQGDAEKLDKLTLIDTWEVEQFTRLVARLKAIPEGEGTLLDSAAILFSSEIEDGDRHSHRNLPVLLAGRCGGALSPGRHVAYGGDEPIANLFITLLGALGVPVDRFGDDGTRALPELA